MMHATSDSDTTSRSPSPPRSPKRSMYFVQSPSRDSNDDYKSSSIQATPSCSSPTDSPSHPSSSRHSRASSSTRFSGSLKGNRRKNGKGWRECKVIIEESDYDDLYYEKGLLGRCRTFLALVGFALLFTIFCLGIWGASKPYKPEIKVMACSFLMENPFLPELCCTQFLLGEGLDATGVPTKMLTANCSMKMSVYNPATFFGIHVSSTSVNLMYAQITAASGQFKKYYQPRKSKRTLLVNLKGDKVPLYGAGASLAIADRNGGVPMKLVFEVQTRGNLVGRELVYILLRILRIADQ
ncbi:hypothetical protein CK203_020739 [Vitis vinifera]|uniref:Uncharacterized protein n=1 Tax=Vitis vinifera TaxID=29760 RepID=A0A438II01_VITVI|nr:hypothetical protein CK203_020739 [Vitis vinifera]